MRKKIIMEIFEALYAIKKRMLTEHKAGTNKYSLPHSQWMVLLVVEQGGRVPIKEVAQSLCITSSAATQVINTLVNKGFLERKDSASDRRTRTIELSDKSRRHIKAMKTEALAKMVQMFSVLSEAELKTYNQISQKILQQK